MLAETFGASFLMPVRTASTLMSSSAIRNRCRDDGSRMSNGAISTAGGVAFDAVDAQFMLHRKPGTFVAGEMLDWEAPTGGYLLQACFATGRAAAHGAMARR